MEVIEGAAVAQVARQFGTSRQSLHSWLKRYETEGEQGLVERSRRPKTSPARLAAEVEALVCELRRAHPRWGPRRIAHELSKRGISPAPGRTTVYRVLTRNNLVEPQEQRHRRQYRRWQRDAPMQLWQMDIMGGVFLADGRECKLVTGIDDHSRFMVITQVVVEPSGRAVCQAFTDAMSRYGVPSEVLTDNGKQFTGRFTKPFPAEVLFEKICRENGITARLTKPRSPTTTGKIERWHQSLRRELLDHCGPFESVQAAQNAIEAWAHAYNHERPHQSLGMATPASLFRPAAALTTVVGAPPAPVVPPETGQAAARDEPDSAAVELDMVISPGGRLCLPGNQQVKFNQALAGRAVTVWADHRSIHVVLDGELIRTRPSRLATEDLATLRLRSPRPAGPEPGTPAASHRATTGASVVEIERTVDRDGNVNLGGQRVALAAHLAGQQVTLRLDGHLLHVVAAGKLARTLPSPIPPEAHSRLRGARATSTPLPPPPAPPLRAVRKVPADGITMVAGQRLRVGRTHAGKTVTVVIDDTVFRVLHNDIELSTHTRKTTKPIGKLRSHANSVGT